VSLRYVILKLQFKKNTCYKIEILYKNQQLNIDNVPNFQFYEWSFNCNIKANYTIVFAGQKFAMLHMGHRKKTNSQMTAS